jgi:hypothetical protein
MDLVCCCDKKPYIYTFFPLFLLFFSDLFGLDRNYYRDVLMDAKSCTSRDGPYLRLELTMILERGDRASQILLLLLVSKDVDYVGILTIGLRM